MGKNKSGKNGTDLILRVPPGTQAYHRGTMIADMITPGEKKVILKGGRGGWGNQHFASSIKQAPEWSKAGERGESMKLRFELKTIADIGLIGLPNAGKSTLLSVISSAKPKIADYPFTTLEPNLGVVKNINGKNIIVADIPGLIAGASQGKGLGDKFLRHIERTKVLFYIIDASSLDVVKDYETVFAELKAFSYDLSQKPETIVLNKTDIISAEELAEKQAALSGLGKKVVVISAATHGGIEDLIRQIKQLFKSK